jgi:hypothetical protein
LDLLDQSGGMWPVLRMSWQFISQRYPGQLVLYPNRIGGRNRFRTIEAQTVTSIASASGAERSRLARFA